MVKRNMERGSTSLIVVTAVVHSLSNVWLSATPWTAARQAPLSFTISWSLLKLTSIELMMSSNYLVLSLPLLLLPSIFPSITVFLNELALCIRWPKYWRFSFSNSPSNEYSLLISFRMDWFDLLAVQGNSQGSSSAWQFKNINSSVFSLFYRPVLLDDWKNNRFDNMDLCQEADVFVLNMLSRFVIAFLSRNKRFFISWLQSLSSVILEAKKINSVTVSTFSLSIFHD